MGRGKGWVTGWGGAGWGGAGQGGVGRDGVGWGEFDIMWQMAVVVRCHVARCGVVRVWL